MSKRKGVSAEEKKTRMLEIFYEKKEFFQLKELENIAPKEKGIIVNSVKGVVESLVDEGLVDTDKIGMSVYFWAFPNKTLHNRKHKLNELQQRYEISSAKLKSITEELNKSKGNELESAERNKLLDEIMDLQIQKDMLEKELQSHENNDAETLKKRQKQTSILKEATNRWTDNVFSIKSWCKNKFNVEEQILDKQFGIPSNFDYLE